MSRQGRTSWRGGAHPAASMLSRMPRSPTGAARGSGPIRVLFVKDRLHETGGTLYYLEMLPRLDPARVSPSLCAFAPRHPIASRFAAAGITPTFFGRRKWDPRCLSDLVRFARLCKADLLHLEGVTSFPFGRLGVHLARRPVILRFNCMLPMSRFRSFLNRQLMSSTWMGIAVSDAVRRWSIQELDISPDRIALLYSGLDIDRFGAPPPGARDRIRREFALADGIPVVGVVGRLHTAQKGQDVLIRAMRTLRVRYGDAFLLLVGDGPDRARCEALVHQLGLDAAVHFAGSREDIPDVLAALDLVIIPSVCDDGLPLVAIEACAAGRPVVAFDSGGLPEVVMHGETGIIVPKGSIDGLAEAIIRILEDSDLAKRLGENGRRYASRFSLSGHVNQLMDLYEAALDEHHCGRRKPSGGLAREGRRVSNNPVACGGPVMASLVRSRIHKLRNELSDRLFEFKPYTKPLPIEGCPLRFFYGTPQAAAWYDPLQPHTRVELEWLARHVAGRREKIIDAGAYHGLYTLVLAKAADPASEVVAVDPVTSNCALIEVNLLLNDLHASIAECAISAEGGEVSFASGACGRIIPQGGTRRPSRRLEAVLPDATVVKLDIEGTEFALFPGQIDALPTTHTWIVEIHPGKGRDPQIILDAFEARGFELWWVDRASRRVARYPEGTPWSNRTSLIALRS
jgi:FkbM family methyltransferase